MKYLAIDDTQINGKLLLDLIAKNNITQREAVKFIEINDEVLEDWLLGKKRTKILLMGF